MAATNKKYAKPVYLVDGSRTPFLKARGKPGPFKHADLGIAASRALLLRMPFEPDAFDEVIFGSTMPGPDEANIARIIALRLGCGNHVPAWTVQRNCASGLQALDSAAKDIALGRAHRLYTVCMLMTNCLLNAHGSGPTSILKKCSKLKQNLGNTLSVINCLIPL